MSSGYTPTLLAAELRALRDVAPGQRFWGFHQPGPWAGGSTLSVNDEAWPVRVCRTPLAVCEVLAEPPAGPGVIILSAVDALALPADVRHRLARRRLHRPNPWDALLGSFKATQVAPTLRPHTELAEALLALAPPGGFPPAPAGFIDPDTVWEQLLTRHWGLPDGRPDALAWLVAAGNPDTHARVAPWPSGLHAALLQRAREWGGPLGFALAQGILAGHGSKLLAAGLVAEVLYADAHLNAPPVVRAQALLEAGLGVGKMQGNRGMQWFEAARAALGKLAGPQQQTVLAQADALLSEHELQAYAQASSQLPTGLHQRTAHMGRVITAVLEGQAALPALEAAFAQVEAHALAAAQPERLTRLRMALRLVRYLATPPRPPAPDLPSAMQPFAAVEGWVDWARRLVFQGESQPELSTAFETILARVQARRDAHDQRFAELLTSWNETPAHTAGVLPIEGVLETVVQPLAAAGPVLLLVLDGMSVGVYEELAVSLAAHGWALLQPATPAPVLSMVPSVTEYARTSLLAGKACRGAQADEKKAFATHPGLHTNPSLPAPLLFHKGELTDGPSGQLAAPVRTALANGRQRVVGVVVNAIDDHLGKTEQVLPHWGVAHIKPLETLLWEARSAKRTVIITSDHGHVAEAGSTLLPGGVNDRHRAASGPPPGTHERLMQGPRIQAVYGAASVVVPTQEAVRYTGKKNGYHGGATLAEMTVPLGVFVPAERLAQGDTLPPGWTPAPPREPTWWHTALQPPTPDAPAAPVPPPPALQALPLFAAAPPAPAPVAHAGTWIDALLGSPTYHAQRQQAGPRAPDDDTMRRFLALLDGNGGAVPRRAVATALSMAELRLPGLLSAMQRVLNLEGYPVVALDETTQEVRLALDLLKTQFELP